MAARRKILIGGVGVAKIVGGGAASARRPRLDPGAVFTIGRRGVQPVPSRPSPNVRMRQAGRGTALAPLYGPIQVDLTLAGSTVPFHIFEGDIHEECLLGADFVAHCVKSFDVERDQLILKDELGGHHIQMRRRTRQLQALAATLRVECEERTLIPERSEVYIPVTVADCDIWNNEGSCVRLSQLSLAARGGACCAWGPPDSPAN